jgi:hypothetical protein
LDWNPQEARRVRVKETWKRTILEEAGKSGKTWSEVERLVGNKRHMEMLHKCPVFLIEQKHILLLLLLLLVHKNTTSSFSGA